MLFDISIVISSYNRDDKILQSVQQLFKSDLSEFTKIEVIVIDDGSPSPVNKLLPQIGLVPAKIEWRLITQKNAGIGATRNRGFREARAGIVIFLDDDILVHKDTIRKLFRAQQQGPGPVIFGNYPFITHSSGAVKKFAMHLYGYDAITNEEKFEKVDAITSGLLSVNKAGFTGMSDFYKDDLSVPAAEEYELIARFHRTGIPIYMARHIYATHNHHLELKWLVQQQYKYGLGTAEAFIKYPEIIEVEKFRVLKQKMDGLGKGSFTNRLKGLAASAPVRKMLLFYTRVTGKIFGGLNRNFIYGILTSAYFWAGYKAGLKRFATK